MFIGAVQDKFSNGLAMMKEGDGSFVIGLGAFKTSATMPKDGVAFYCNDFMLSDPEPWKIPAEVMEVKDLKEIGVEKKSLKVDWQDLAPEGFASVFSEINEMINRGTIEKSVPVATEKGVLLEGGGVDLLGQLDSLDSPFYSYAWVDGDKGFCGATPELLFDLNDRRLKTMALAGTAKAEERDVFSVDGKEIREHEFVAQTLVAKLSDIGDVSRGARAIMDLGKLVHFHTAIDVELFSSRDVDDLIKRLHPTPALGPLPRTAETMHMLEKWRKSLDCPSYFGSPFGLLKEGAFRSVVAIRGIHWEGEKVAVPSGCGVIEASRLVNEWRELRLKRESVKSVFNLI